VEREMRHRSKGHHLVRRLIALSATAACQFVLFSSDAIAEPSDAALASPPSLAERAEFAYWRGRICTTPACKRARPASTLDIASFGLVALGGAWYARRRAALG